MSKLPRSNAGPRLASSSDPVRDLQSDAALQQALRLRDAGRFAEAVALCGTILRDHPNHVGTLYLMGTLAHQLGSMDIAVESLQQAAANAPKAAEIRVALGKALAAARRHEEAIRAFKRAIALNPASAAAHRGLGQAQLDLGMHGAALKNFERVLALRPGDLQAAYFVAAIKERTAAGQGESYVRALFDSYTEQFDAHLTRLGYRLPELIGESLAPRRFDTALDIGCGTGLVGLALRERVGAIDGIDVSEPMIGKAGERGIYRTLAVGEAVALLRTDPRFAGPYDLVAAADVFIYVGRLEEMFAAVSERLSPNGLFTFSVETNEAGDVTIQGSGRFGHSAGYIARLADRHGLAIADRKAIVLREEFGSLVAGALYTLNRD